MRTDLNLPTLAREIERQNKPGTKLDLVAPYAKLSMTTNARLNAPTNGDSLARDMSSIAHEQMARRLGIDKRYYDRCLEHAPDLLADNVNTWLQKEPATRTTVRIMDNKVRALLSDRYQVIDHHEIAEVALPILMEQPEMQIVSTSITERKLYIKAVFPRVAGEVKKGDVVQAGVVITNSEVGLGAFVVSPLIYRLVCLNGMILPDGRVRGYHVGGRAAESDEVFELISDETKQAQDRAFLLKARDLIRACADPRVLTKRIEKMTAATKQKLEGDPAKAIEVLAQKAALTDPERGSVLRHLIEGGDLSRWGVLNAVTRTANDHDSYDRATELEQMGSTILNLAPSEWREIAEAA